MLIPEPEPGLVIRYSFLWSHEAQQRAIEGSKDRPCAIILVVQTPGAETRRVSVLPITHTPPLAADAITHLKLTPAECKRAGLDGAEHWVVLAELNRFSWPGHDLRPVPGTQSCVHGSLPQASYRRIVSAFLAFDDAVKQGRSADRHTTQRDG